MEARTVTNVIAARYALPKGKRMTATNIRTEDEALDTIERLDRFVATVERRLQHRLIWGRQSPVALRLVGVQLPSKRENHPAPSEHAICATQDQYRFVFRNRHGMEANAWIWPTDGDRRRRGVAALTVRVMLTAEVQDGCWSLTETPDLDEVSQRPQRYERDAYRMIRRHNSYMTEVLRGAGLRRSLKTYQPPIVERQAREGDPSRAGHVTIWSESDWSRAVRSFDELTQGICTLMASQRPNRVDSMA